MDISAAITLATLIGIFLLLVRDIVAPSVAFLVGLSVLVVAGIVPISEAFEGFGNENLITIAALFVIARTLEGRIKIDAVSDALFGASRNIRMSLLRIVIPVSAMSAFLNNTPIVAMLINPIIHWSKKSRLPSSKFLIPLSYAAILGGALTLIGTSTNLVVSGLLSDYGHEPFSFFELTKVSLPLAVIGLGTIVVFAPRLIPERALADIDVSEIEKDFILDTLPGKSIIGKTVNQAGLRALDDVYLAEIIRKTGEVMPAVAPATRIKSGDILRFSGNAASLMELADNHNLLPIEDEHADRLVQKTTYIEAVIGHNPSIIGRTLADIGFPAKYQAAVLAIFRAGEKTSGSLINIPLKPGDSLLLVSDEDFIRRWKSRNDFLFMRQIGRSKNGSKNGSLRLGGVVALTLALLVFGVPLSVAALSGALAAVLLGLITTAQAREAIDFDLLVMIAAAFGVAKGVDSSGLAGDFSSAIIGFLDGFGGIGLLVGVILSTTILTEVITNAAAALLIFPIAMATASQSGGDPRMFAIAIAVTASLSFVSPLGYQTNTMVYSAGAYKFGDFLRLGLLLNVVTAFALTVLLWFYFRPSF